MDIQNRKELKAAADRSLASAAYDPKKLVLLYTSVTLLFSLLISALDFLLGDQIAGTGGLGGMGLRSVLSTAQSVLRLANTVVLPFWEIGYIFAVLRWSRSEPAAPKHLLEGFRRWGPFLRLTLLQAAIYVGIAIVCLYLAMQIFLVTPFAAPLYEIAGTLTTETVLDAATQYAIMDAYMPMLGMFLVIYLVAAIPFMYQYRMASYALLDDPNGRALAALRTSRHMMRGNRFSLFRLDLSFWWFYGLQFLLMVVCYGDLLLPLVGVTLPFSETVSFFLFYCLSLILQLALYVWARNKLETTYAHAYGALKNEPIVESQPVVPKNQPWRYE